MIQRKQITIDADGRILGRVASDAAVFLSGKDRPDYAPNIDKGGIVVVKNADKFRVSGNKEEKKFYYSFSGYPGGIRKISLKDLKKKNPAEVIRKAVYNMLPKNKLRPERIKRLKLVLSDEK